MNDLDVYLNSVFKLLIENFFIHIHQGDYPIVSFFFFTVFISAVGPETVTLTYILHIYVHTCVNILHMYTHTICVCVCMRMYVYICVYIILKVIGFVVDSLPFLFKHGHSNVARILIFSVARWPSS